MYMQGVASTREILEISNSSQGTALLTESAGTLTDVPGMTVSTILAAQGDILLIHGSFVLSGDGGTISEGLVTVVDNGTVTDLAITERLSDNAGTLMYYAFTAKYVVAHAPSSGPPGTTTVKYRGRRFGGSGNAYFRAPCSLIVQCTRGL